VGKEEAHLRAISERARKLQYKPRGELRVSVSFSGCDLKGSTDGDVEITGEVDLDIDAI